MTAFLNPDDLDTISKLAKSDASETLQKRAQLLLGYEEGLKTAEIAEQVDLSPGRVLYWRRRYLRDGMDVFGDAVTDSDRESDKPAAKAPLAKLIKRARRAEKEGDVAEAVIEELGEGIERAEKRRRKLKKGLKGAKKKKASRAKSKLGKLDKRIKRARKTLRKLSP